MVVRYVPLIRSKSGEAIALANLTLGAKNRVFPIVHLTVGVAQKFKDRLIADWSGRAIAIDGLYNFSQTASPVEMLTVIADLRAGGVPAQPCIDVTAPAAYVAAMLPLVVEHGVVVKVRIGDLGNVVAWCAANGLSHAQVDLVLCAGHLPDVGQGVLDPIIIHHLQNFPAAGTWRSVTLASSSAPKDHTGLALGANYVPRLDWMLWQAVRNLAPFRLDFGDYGIGHPDMAEPPGVAMARATVSARYTRDQDWIVLKGRPISGTHGIPMATQYHSHAGVFQADPGFGGLASCWGDGRVVQISTGATSSGNRQTWVSLSANRHMELVVDRLP